MMNRRNKIIIFASVFALVLGLFYWQPNTTKKQISVASLSDANYFFKQVNLKQFDENGLLANQLNATKMSHYSDKNISNIEQPLVTLVSKQQTEWQVSALTGKLNHNQEKLMLDNDVSISQYSTLPKKINTSNLVIDLQKKLATTDDNVLIFSGNSQTTAKGMHADFSKEEIKLHHQVETLGTTK